jgi:oligopeptide transport system substrate-binding protein
MPRPALAPPAPRAFVLAAMALGALASACTGDRSSPYFGSTERTGKGDRTFYVNNSGEPEYLDPGQCVDTVGEALDLQLFEGLTSYDPRDGHPVQGVATSWDQSADNRLFRFHLRPDAKWSDGAPVTAHDFEYAWRRVLRPETASRGVNNLYLLKNGEPFSQGKLKALARDAALLTEPRPGSRAEARLSKGSFVQIDAPAEKGWVRVSRFDALPTFSGAAPPAAAPPAAGFLPEVDLVEDASILGVRALDDRTLDVELERPTPYFLRLTSYQTLFPVRRDVVEAFDQRGEGELWVRPENIVSNGPYVLDDWKFRYEITMRPNPHYWRRDKLKIDRIVWMEVEEYHSSMNLYKTAEIDYLGDNTMPPAEYLPLLDQKRDFVHNNFLAVQWYEFNTKKPPLDDARVRKALNISVDKRQLVDKILRGGELPATHYVPDFTGLGYSAALAQRRAAGSDPFASPEAEFDPERARALLREAGYEVTRQGDGYHAQGFPAVEVIYNSNEGHRQVAVAIQDMWKQHLGITVALRSEEWKVMLKSYRDGQFQVIRLGWVADYDHPQTFLEQFLSDNPQNQTGWREPRFDEMLRRAAATADPAESIRLYQEAESLAVTAMARMPIYFDTRSTLVKPWVKGFWGSTLNPHLVQYLWIDPDWRKGGENVPAYLPEELPPPGRIGSP